MSGALRYVLLVTHRWLGLSSAAVLLVAGATGALLAWPWPGEDSSWRPAAARLHESLGLGRLGYWIVSAASALAVLLVLGGLVLWWKQKILVVRAGGSWWRVLCDLHHVVGVFGSGVMVLLALSGIGVTFLRPDDGLLFVVAFALHTTRGFPWPVKLLYLLGTTTFIVQVVTGTAMWGRAAYRRFQKQRQQRRGRRASDRVLQREASDATAEP